MALQIRRAFCSGYIHICPAHEIHVSLDRAWRVYDGCDDSFALHVFRRRAPDLHTSFCFVGSKVDLMLIVQWIPRSVPVSSIASQGADVNVEVRAQRLRMLWLFLLACCCVEEV